MGQSQRVQEHSRVWERSQAVWKPTGTYTLLGIIGAVWVLQWIIGLSYPDLYVWTFLVGPDWYLRPWSLITSTLSHSVSKLSHILFNGFTLFFFGPILERILGLKRFFLWFFVAGAISGIAQVSISGNYALGASGAIMFVMGVLVVLMPKQTILIYGLIPAPFWVMIAGFVVLDIMGVISPGDVGNVAHLSGLVLGAWYGYRLKTAPVRPASWT